MILCRSFSLQGFLEVPGPWGYGFAFPVNEPALVGEYIQYSTAVYHGILTSCTEMVRFKIKPFADGYYPAAETWKFLHTEYASEENMGHNDLIYQMQKLKLVPGKADAYVAQKLRLRDQLFAVNYPVTRMSFNDFLVQGLPEHWETFKTTMRGQIRHLTEEQMIAYIQDEDRHLQARNGSDVMYAVSAPPRRRVSTTESSTSEADADTETLHCTFCNKSGHTAAKCWNKPPYYCPKCKAQGHNLQNCPEKGKKSSNPKREGGNAKQNSGRKEKEETSLLLI